MSSTSTKRQTTTQTQAHTQPDFQDPRRDPKKEINQSASQHPTPDAKHTDPQNGGTKQQFIRISPGGGQPVMRIEWQENDTVAAVLLRAGITTIGRGRTIALGSRRVRHPDKTPIQPGEAIVIAGKPNNG